MCSDIFIYFALIVSSFFLFIVAVPRATLPASDAKIVRFHHVGCGTGLGICDMYIYLVLFVSAPFTKQHVCLETIAFATGNKNKNRHKNNQ